MFTSDDHELQGEGDFRALDPVIRLKEKVTKTSTVNRKVSAERIYMARPINYVVMVGRVLGDVKINALKNAVRTARVRHPLLGCRFEITPSGKAYLTNESVPPIPVTQISRDSEKMWEEVASREHETFFPVITGPLARVALIYTPVCSEIVVTTHHAISDGISLTFLLQDILSYLAVPPAEVQPLPVPPPINAGILPVNAGSRLQRWLIRRVNAIWKKRQVQFDESDMVKLHEAYWEQNQGCIVFGGELSEEKVKGLIEKCRNENVTVHTALMTAFAIAQSDIQGRKASQRKKFHMPVDMRERFVVPVPKTLGFYAASLIFSFEPASQKTFWENARGLHGIVRGVLQDKKLFRLYTLEGIDPTLMDATYFQKYGLINERLPRFLNRKTGVNGFVAGLAVTNLGRVNIPREYGDLTLTALYGPSVYAEILEKIVSVATLGDRMYFTLTFEEGTISREIVEKVYARAVEILDGAIRS